MARSTRSKNKGIGVSLESGLLTAFYWKRKGTEIKILDSLFLSSLVLDESMALDPEDQQRLIEFLQQYESKSDEIIVEIPRNAVLIRHLKLPALSDQDLEQMLNYEVERHVPFSKPDIYYDSQILSRNEKEVQVLLVVAKKQLIESCLEYVKTDKSKPTAILVSSFSLLNLLMSQRPARWKLPHHVGVIHVNPHYVEVSFISNKTLDSSFTIPIKERPWQDFILGSRLRELDATPSQEVEDYQLQSFTKWLISEVGKFLLKQEFLGKGRVDKLILVQPGLPNIEHAPPLGQHLDIPVEVEDFSNGVKTKRISQGTLLRSKSGLALKDTESEHFKVDLLPRSLAVPKPPKLYLTATLLAALCLISGAIYFGRFFKERATLNWVQEQVVLLEPQVKVVTEMRNNLKSLKEQTETLIDIENQGPGMLEILKELTLKTPEYAWLKGIKVVENRVDIWGYSNHSKGGQASDLIRLFSDSVLFERPSFAEPIQTIGRDTETFRMTMEISKSRQRQKSQDKVKAEEPGKKSTPPASSKSASSTGPEPAVNPTKGVALNLAEGAEEGNTGLNSDREPTSGLENTGDASRQKTTQFSIKPVAPPLHPKIALEEDFGGKLRLQGYDLSHHQIGRGDDFEISYYWKLLTKLENRYAVFVHITRAPQTFYEKAIYDLRKKIGLARPSFFQQDHFLLQERGTLDGAPFQGSVGEISKESYRVKVPENLESGTYEIWVGIWNPERQEKLPTKKGSKVKIGQIQIL